MTWCLDGNLTTYCSTNVHLAPHMALVYAQPVRFLEITITNRYAKSMPNVVVVKLKADNPFPPKNGLELVI
jgi:hypothetical protein